MIFADKLIELRKRAGWSQEELAEQMGVTRQSVSKWEGAQSIPDLDKILRLSELFGVSTDYLLKDEIENTSPSYPQKDALPMRHVSMEEANAFLSAKATTSKSIALGVLLCILSPIALILLGGLSELGYIGLSDGAAGGIGMIVLLILVSVAVGIFILSGGKTSRFDYLEKEIFEAEHGVSPMVRERREQYKNTYIVCNTVGACLSILSLVPLFSCIVLNDQNELMIILSTAAMLALIGVGVVFFVRSGIVWASFEKLLQEGEYSHEQKTHPSVTSAVSSAYWLIAAAVFLTYSFSTSDWERSWIVWMVAGVLFPAVIGIVRTIEKRK